MTDNITPKDTEITSPVLDNIEKSKEVKQAVEVAEKKIEDIKQEVKTIAEKQVVVHEKDDGYNVEVIIDYDGKVDIFYLSKKDPMYEYRFLKDTQSNLSRKTGNILLQQGGWQLVPREHLLKIGVRQEFIGGDGLYRVGELVLARIPKELFEKKEKYKMDKAKEKSDATKRKLKEGDSSLAGVGHTDMKGLQTAKDLGMK